MERRLSVACLMLATLAVILPAARAQKAGPDFATVSSTGQPTVSSASLNKGANANTVPVEQISNRVEKVIKIVEQSTLSCEARNEAVQRLRILDDALRSGRRSAARSYVLAWHQHAWSMEAARVIGPELGSSLQNQLNDLADQIGYGWEEKPGPLRRWKALPSCEPGTADVLGSGELVAGSYNPGGADPMNMMKIFLKMLLGKAPEVGGILSGMVDLLWPTGSSATDNNFQELVDQTTYDLVSARLGGLMLNMSSSSGTGWNDQVAFWKRNCANPAQAPEHFTCADYATNTLWTSFQSKKDNFDTERQTFQQTGHEVKLLPLYAQYENLYLALLRDGMMLHDQYWSKVSGTDSDDMAGTAMNYELTNTNEDSGISYVNKFYKAGLPAMPKPPQDWDHPFSYNDEYNARVQYIRDSTFNILDYRDTWKYLDPRSFPGGVPGGVKLTRMIYSGITGWPHTPPNPPSNVAGPLKELSLWTKVSRDMDGQNHLIGSVQATNPPLLGPVQSGPIAGTLDLLANHAHYYNLADLGPISTARIQWTSSCGSSRIGFVWAKDGSTSWQGDPCGNFGYTSFNFADEVLATIYVPSHMGWDSKSGNIADAFMFGFRYADSFNPAGSVVGVGSGMCMDVPLGGDGTQIVDGTQTIIRTCGLPVTSTQIWTYDPALQQISVTNPAEYSDLNPTTSGKHCLDTAGSWRSPVVVAACDDGAVTYDAGHNPVVSTQRWDISAVGTGIAKITNVKSGLVLSGNYSVPYSGAKLVLYNYTDGNGGQQWRGHDPFTGEIHGIGSGKCLDVPDYSTTPGTQVQIYDCHGNAAQQWTYNPNNKELIYAMAPSLCLEARGAGTAAGTAAQINNCNGGPEQQWTLQGLSTSINQGGGGAIINANSSLVLDVKGGSPDSNTLVQLYTPKGVENQQWSRTASPGGILYSVAGAKCVDTSGEIFVTIQNCANPLRTEQKLTYHPIAQTYTVNNAGTSWCLDAVGSSVVMDECAGLATQMWSRNFHSYTVTNVGSGLALDLDGGATTAGTILQLTPLKLDSDNNPLPTATQKWVWSLN